jgi:hypothetical protein
VECEIGLVSDIPRPDPAFVQIPAKTVVTERGASVEVKPFSISRRPVTVGNFERFVQATAHLTTAEQQGATESFRDNFSLSAVAPSKRHQLTATCVSYLDAIAFCQWAAVRLPTECEWLAAAIVDQNVYDEVADHKRVYDPQGALWAVRHKLALSELSAEWTGTRDPTGLVVVRAGPVFVLTKGWEADENGNRLLWPPESYDVTVGFRTVALPRALSDKDSRPPSSER